VSNLGCRAKTKAGASCRAPALPGRDVCIMHAPDMANKIAAARMRGGEAAAKLRLLQGRRLRLEHQGRLARFLSDLAEDTLAGSVSPDVCRAVVSACSTLRQVVETAELERRLEALEARLAQQPRAAGWG
jgi:hypothetical protein